MSNATHPGVSIPSGERHNLFINALRMVREMSKSLFFCSLLTRHYRVFSLVIELDKSARFGHSQRARPTRFPWGRLQSAPYEGVSVFVNPFVTKSGDEVDELGFGVDPYFLINMTTMSDGRTFSDEESLLYAVQTMAARKNP